MNIFLFLCSFLVIPHISPSAKWTQNGVTVAGGRGKGSTTDKLNNPHGLFVDDDQTILVADQNNHRIVQWKMGDAKGQVVAGGRGKGSRLDQLNLPTDVLVDKETDRLIICDYENQRVVRWSRQSSTIQGEILIDNIDCFGLVMDDQRNLYVSDDRNYVVWRYRLGDKNGTLVAGGHRKGSGLNEFANLHYIFVDRQQTVYVSDTGNHRVMKWNKGATEGIIVGGGQGQGIGLTDLAAPYGLFVDTLGTLYVADFINNQVKRWLKGETWGTAIVGGDSPGQEANQFSYRSGLSFDRHGNLYVVDQGNNRIQRFSIQ